MKNAIATIGVVALAGGGAWISNQIDPTAIVWWAVGGGMLLAQIWGAYWLSE